MNDLFRYKGVTKPLYDGKGGHITGGYVNGEVYMLELTGRGMYYSVFIANPVHREYDTWNRFLEEWERV